jgi:hypothetical protein
VVGEYGGGGRGVRNYGGVVNRGRRGECGKMENCKRGGAWVRRGGASER